MKYHCHICDQVCSTPYNLRRHYKCFHGEGVTNDTSLSSRYQPYLKGIPVPAIQSVSNQIGRGNDRDDAEEKDMTTVSDAGDNGATDDDDGDNESDDTDDDEGEDSEEQEYEHKEDKNAVFDRFMLSFEVGDTLAERKKLFRTEFADFLVYMLALKKNHIYKKVMISARDFDGNGLDFTRAESLRHAVKQRKFLLDELVEEHMADESDDDDDDDDDDENLDAPH